MASIQVFPLASSSKGNAYLLVADGGEKLLIDDGLSYAELRRRLGALSLDLEGLTGILLTHSHNDHVSGIKTLLKHHPEVAVYANSMTAETLIADEVVPEAAFICFENGQEFALGPFTVNPFAIPHDTADPVGYLVRAGEGADATVYFHGTDIGTPLDSIGLKLRAADVATLESNHDPVMLRTSGRAACLIQRIAGPRGHLSNDQAAGLVKRFASPKLKRLMLAHLSRDCNTPVLAERVMRETLGEMHREDVELEVLAP